tara:strand:- start:203 stop:487 length:285 start_codon:yes stop_codon:yes gene_type:complete
MSTEGYRDISPTAPPQEEVLQTQEVQYINSYPNNYIYHNNPTELLNLQRAQLDKEVALQIQRMENEIQEEKQKTSIWKKLCLCISCIFCCCITL